MVGSRLDNVPFMQWSWRTKAGIDEFGKNIQRGKGDHGSSVPGVGVLECLASLKQDDHERIELSKKISWIVRHGAMTINVNIDDDGWVSVDEILRLDVLEHINANKFFEVVTESNRQKKRYELKETKEGYFIRAIGRKAPYLSNVGAREQRSTENWLARSSADNAKDQNTGKERRKIKGGNGLSSRFVENGPEEGMTVGMEGACGKDAGKGAARCSKISPKDFGGKGKNNAKEIEIGSVTAGSKSKREMIYDLGQPNTATSCKDTPNNSMVMSPPNSHLLQHMQTLQQMQAMHHLQMMHRVHAMQQVQAMQQAQAMYSQYQIKVRHQLQEARALQQMQAPFWETPGPAFGRPWQSMDEWCEAIDHDVDQQMLGPYDGSGPFVWEGSMDHPGPAFYNPYIEHHSPHTQTCRDPAVGLRRVLESNYD